jgi:ABC-2 type transport system permease protein
MHNVWLVAKHEYGKIVKRRAFLIATLGVPLLIVGVMAISILVALGGRGDKPLGYVDRSGVLADPVMPEDGEGRVALRAFPDVDAAQAALEADEVQGFYLVPEFYVITGEVELFFQKNSPSERVQGDFEEFLRANLIESQPTEVQQRLHEGNSITIRAADGRREMDSDNFLNFLVPFAAGMFFIFAVMSSGGYMLQAITDEKENRTVEILTTSIQPLELIGGKALGLMSVGLTQLLIWLTTGVLALLVASVFLEGMQAIDVPWPVLIVVAAFFVPAYALMAGLMTAVGSAVPDLQQGQQISGIMNMLFTAPFFFVALIIAKPNHPIVVALSLFPTTAFITITVRWGITTVPIWQIILSWLLLVAAASLSVWAAARIFRIGMLRYGQRLSLQNILAGLRGQREPKEAVDYA